GRPRTTFAASPRRRPSRSRRAPAGRARTARRRSSAGWRGYQQTRFDCEYAMQHEDLIPAAVRERDLVGYGATPPAFEWPGGASVVINLVLVYEEGSEYS